MRTIDIDIDMSPGGHAPTVHVNQGDTDFGLVIHLYNSRGVFTVENGTTAKLRGRKPGGAAYERSGTLTGKDVAVAGGTDMTDTAGKGVFEVCLMHSGKSLFSQNFYIVIEPKADDGSEGGPGV